MRASRALAGTYGQVKGDALEQGVERGVGGERWPRWEGAGQGCDKCREE